MSPVATLHEVLRVLEVAAAGDDLARVSLPPGTSPDSEAARVVAATNRMLDDRALRLKRADRASARLAILAEAAHTFAELTRDHQQLLEKVAERLAKVVKDQCLVRLLSEDGRRLLTMAVHAPDRESERRMRAVMPELLELQPLARRVLETGEPYCAPNVDLESLRTRTTPEYFDYVKGIGLHSLLVVPLRCGGRSLGMLTLLRNLPASPPFDADDLELTTALADHAALAIENARSYGAEREARVAAEKAREEQRVSEEHYRLMFDHSPLPKWLMDQQTLRFLDVNEAAVRMSGYSRAELLELTVKDLTPAEELPALRAAIGSAKNEPHVGIWKHRRKTGEILLVDLTTHTFMLGARVCRLTVGRDVTEQVRLEEQFRQAQKMEAVGRLAGGVAHDFNNIMSVVLSYGEMLLAQTRPGDPMREDLEEITRAGKRATELTRQLLMFSRQQVLAPRVLDLNEVLAGMDKLLRRILGADIDLVSRPAPMLGRVRADPTSLEQVIMNLVVNARDAMPRGGKLTLETGSVGLDEAYAKLHLGVTPGPHVMLAVTDTGTGIDKATMARIFEPFFTTKGIGKGTGLGLSTVFGIAQQSGGSVWVYSEVGKGTTFKVYLPAVAEKAQPAAAAAPSTGLRGTETILLVEDDDQVRGVALAILRSQGYSVIDARNAGEALLLAEKHAGTIDLLLTDVVMPQMSGPELAKRLASSRPDMKVLCMSGYTDDSIVRHGVLESHLAFLQKPITPQALGTKVREVLDAAPGRRPD